MVAKNFNANVLKSKASISIYNIAPRSHINKIWSYTVYALLCITKRYVSPLLRDFKKQLILTAVFIQFIITYKLIAELAISSQYSYFCLTVTIYLNFICLVCKSIISIIIHYYFYCAQILDSRRLRLVPSWPL